MANFGFFCTVVFVIVGDTVDGIVHELKFRTYNTVTILGLSGKKTETIKWTGAQVVIRATFAFWQSYSDYSGLFAIRSDNWTALKRWRLFGGSSDSMDLQAL